MEDNRNMITRYRIYEDKPKATGQQVDNRLEADIQVAYLNMLHEKGLLSDNIHSIALSKTIKGVI